MAGSNGSEKSHIHRYSIPGPPQPVTSRYAEYAVPVHNTINSHEIIM